MTTYPSEDDKILKWQSREKTERLGFVIYADFESCLVPVHDKTKVVHEHIPSGFCAYTVSTDSEFESEPLIYSGRDCMEVFYDHLAKEQDRISVILREKKAMLPLSDEELCRFDQTTTCCRCRQTFSNENMKVRHHNHRTGRYIQALCNRCNLQIKSTDFDFFIQVVFHNLKKL